MDTSLFLDINHFASRTAYLHGLLSALAGSAGLALLAALVLLGLLQARFARSREPASGGALVSGLLAVAVALGIAEAIGRVLGRARPAQSLKGIVVIGSPAGGFSLPDLHAAAAAAVAVALLVIGVRALGSLAALAALAVAFAEIYVGAHFPVDELAGIGVGGAVSLAAWPLLRRPVAISRMAPTRGTPSLTAELAGLGRAGALAHAGPAATPVPIAASGSVRLLEGPAGGEVGTLPRPRVPAAAATASGSAASSWSLVVGATSPGARTPAEPPALRPPVPGQPSRGSEGSEQHPRSNVAIFTPRPETEGN